MQQQAHEEGVCLQRHSLLPIPLATVAIGEADVAVTDIDKTVVGHRDAVRVPPEILQDLLGSSPRRLGVDDPLWLSGILRGAKLLYYQLLMSTD
jgi:hypothetical protein